MLKLGAVVEEFAEADGEEKIVEEGVFEAGEQKGLRRMIGDGKESAAEDGERNGRPVAKGDMDEAEG